MWEKSLQVIGTYFRETPRRSDTSSSPPIGNWRPAAESDTIGQREGRRRHGRQQQRRRQQEPVQQRPRRHQQGWQPQQQQPPPSLSQLPPRRVGWQQQHQGRQQGQQQHQGMRQLQGIPPLFPPPTPSPPLHWQQQGLGPHPWRGTGPSFRDVVVRGATGQHLRSQDPILARLEALEERLAGLASPCQS